jgi:hypothetical protein
MDDMAERYKALTFSFDQRAVILQFYMEIMPDIVRLAVKSPGMNLDLYPVDWKFNKNTEPVSSTITSKSVET